MINPVGNLRRVCGVGSSMSSLISGQREALRIPTTILTTSFTCPLLRSRAHPSLRRLCGVCIERLLDVCPTNVRISLSIAPSMASAVRLIFKRAMSQTTHICIPDVGTRTNTLTVLKRTQSKRPSNWYSNVSLPANRPH